jgi:hypothetical protein
MRRKGKGENKRAGRGRRTHFALSRSANSSWNMITALRKKGRCASSLNTIAEEML